jgi:hypothetical protein
MYIMKKIIIFVFIPFVFLTCTESTNTEIGTARIAYRFETEFTYDRGDTIPNSTTLSDYDSLWSRVSSEIREALSEGDSILSIHMECDLSRSFEYGDEVATPWTTTMNSQLGEQSTTTILRRFKDICDRAGMQNTDTSLLISVDTSRVQVLVNFTIRPSPDIDGESCFYQHLNIARLHHDQFGYFPQDSLAQFRKGKIVVELEVEKKSESTRSETLNTNSIRTHDGASADWLLWTIFLLIVLEIALLIWSFGPRESGKVFAVMLGTSAALTAGAYLLSLVDWSTAEEGIAHVVRIVFAVGFVALFVRTLILFGEWFAQFRPAISDWFARGLIRYPVHFQINRYEMFGIILVGGYLLWNIISDILSVLF